MSLRLVAFVTLCVYMQNAAAQTKIKDHVRFVENISNCGLHEFRCRNGQCISNILLCNGRADCLDSSDEVRNECDKAGTFNCTTRHFRCDYGACVDGDAACNGVQDCIDNSDENPVRCTRRSRAYGGVGEPPTCRGDQYKCDNGQCIGSSEVCDGNIDCVDRSDETSKICGSYNCPQTVFRCNYGACINRDLKCDGEVQCADGSDEDPQLCSFKLGSSKPTTIATATTRRTNQRPEHTTKNPYNVEQPSLSQKPSNSWANQQTQRPSSNQWTEQPPSSHRPFRGSSCPLPQRPQNGNYKLDHCPNQRNCDVPSDMIEIEQGGALRYTCNKGYKLNISDSRIYCSSVGIWSVIPVCEAITCPLLDSTSRSARCATVTGKWIPCDNTEMTPGISVKLTCRGTYIQDTSDSSAHDVVKCNGEGTWEPRPINCLESDVSEPSINVNRRPTLSQGQPPRPEHTTQQINPSLNQTRPTDNLNLHLRPPSSGKNYCPLPPQPENGRYILNHCPNQQRCDVPSGTAELEQGDALLYVCNTGYKLNNSDSRIYCSSVGTWSVIPVCEAITCPPLSSAARDADCRQPNGDWIACESGVRPGTSATLTCRNSYIKDTTDLTALDKVKCNSKGEWEPKPINCFTVCGVATSPGGKPLIVNGSISFVSEFPWHGTLYVAENLEKKFICGATVIKENMLITAAHCVYDETKRKVGNPSKYYVAVGNIFKDFDYMYNDAQTFRTARVKRIYRHCNYLGLAGNYAMDIAILIIDKPLVLSALLMPICLDTSNLNDQVALEVGNHGRVSGFGRTATGHSSAILQTITVPYVSQKVCKAEAAKHNTERFITGDKFCAGYTNGSSVCDGDSGGGLVFKTDGKWYLRGIVSVAVGSKKYGTKFICDSDTYALYTRVSNHMDWIQKVISSEENHKPLADCH